MFVGNIYLEVVYLVGNQLDWKTSEDYVSKTVLHFESSQNSWSIEEKRILRVSEGPFAKVWSM